MGKGLSPIALAEEENAAAAAATKYEEELQRTNLERWMEAVAANLEIRMGAAAEAGKICKRGI